MNYDKIDEMYAEECEEISAQCEEEDMKRFDDFTEVVYEDGFEITVNHHCDENGDDIITKNVTNVAVNPAYDYEAGIDY